MTLIILWTMLGIAIAFSLSMENNTKLLCFC